MTDKRLSLQFRPDENQSIGGESDFADNLDPRTGAAIR